MKNGKATENNRIMTESLKYDGKSWQISGQLFWNWKPASDLQLHYHIINT